MEQDASLARALCRSREKLPKRCGSESSSQCDSTDVASESSFDICSDWSPLVSPSHAVSPRTSVSTGAVAEPLLLHVSPWGLELRSTPARVGCALSTTLLR